MENKPFHYDGSIGFQEEANDEKILVDGFEITDEIRKNISGNPYRFE